MLALPVGMSIDARWYLDVNSFARRTSWAHGFASDYALWGGLVALSLLLVFGWLWGRQRDDAPRAFAAAVLCGISTLVALGINHFISDAVARQRPFLRFPHAETLVSRSHDYSMPSDHTMIAGAFVVGLWLLDRRVGAIAAVLAALLAFTRVYVGVHYPGDVAAGLAIGGAIAAAICVGLRRPATALAERLLDTPLRPLIAAEPPPAPSPR
jgi:membrane-associated phospholipid phosphatase